VAAALAALDGGWAVDGGAIISDPSDAGARPSILDYHAAYQSGKRH
jgi:hypothetical protein